MLISSDAMLTLLLLLASRVHLKAEHGAASCASTPVIETLKKKI